MGKQLFNTVSLSGPLKILPGLSTLVTFLVIIYTEGIITQREHDLHILSPHFLFCVSKPVLWKLIHDYGICIMHWFERERSLSHL